MYAVEVRDHIMIAHSLKGEVFGPAQRLHGATYVVDVAFFREKLGPDNIVVDIGRALDALKSALHSVNYANLDEHPALAGQLTTTEFLCRYIFDRMAEAIRDGRLGAHADGIERMRVVLNESHVARAWYEASLGG
ncbi:MAG TPA: 6-carboxytetrahydropterin synthase [Alphaproteobacteria bacterium]|nr:6-carboxytetrahydropterin synthase [Alphaproteobacteria bacterium]